MTGIAFEYEEETVASNGHSRSLVVIQLSGGNDSLNTVIPYNDSQYYDFRPTVRMEQDSILPLDDQLGFRPNMEPMKEIWDQGDLAIISGIGYPNPNRSHFRSMDIWHTAEPDHIANEGWLGRTIRDLDPKGRERAHWRQLRTRSAAGAGDAGAYRLPRSATWKPMACSPTSRTRGRGSKP